LLQNPQVMALSSALCSAVATIFIQRGLHRSNFYAGFWINIAVGVIGLWSLVLLLVPFADYNWRAVPYFVSRGGGHAGGRLFRVVAIHKVGASVASAVNNWRLSSRAGWPFSSSGAGDPPHRGETLVICSGPSCSLGVESRGSGCGISAIAPRRLMLRHGGRGAQTGLGHAGPLFDSAVNITAALIASTTFVVATGKHGSLWCDRRSLRYFIAGGIAENAGVFLVLASLGFGDVSIVTPLAGTSPLFVLLLAYFFPSHAEKLTWRVVVGAVLIVLGVVMLSR
jgi:uncharacterized membrane protein